MSFSLSEYTKIDVGWGFAPDPTGGAYNATGPLAGFKWAASRQEGNGGEVRQGLWEGKEGKGGEYCRSYDKKFWCVFYASQCTKLTATIPILQTM